MDNDPERLGDDAAGTPAAVVLLMRTIDTHTWRTTGRRRGRAMTTVTRIKRIRSHAGHGRFLSLCDEAPVGTIPRQITTPYAYAQTHQVLRWGTKHVVVAETAHKVYDVYEVTGPIGPVEENL